MIGLMKKIFGIITGTASSLVFALPAFAQTPVVVQACPAGAWSGLCTLGAERFGEVIGRIIQLAFVIATLAALIWLIYGGLKWIVSGGDKTEVEGARNHIVAAIIGLIVIFISYLVINVILGFFVPGTSLTSLQLPNLKQNLTGTP